MCWLGYVRGWLWRWRMFVESLCGMLLCFYCEVMVSISFDEVGVCMCENMGNKVKRKANEHTHQPTSHP